MVEEIELIQDNEELNRKKGEILKVYKSLADKLINEKKAKYAIIKKPKEGEDK